jgi:AcrR family transcriptional regulator
MQRRRRARNDEAKRSRRSAILDTAWQLFQGTPYSAVAMAEVAERAGLAKGTLYLYFKTKEELFLALQEQQLMGWFDEVDRALAADRADRADWPSGDVVSLLCGTLERRPGVARLLAILSPTLEQNIPFAEALRFKRQLAERLAVTGALLERRLLFLATGEGAQLLLRCQALVIGLQHLADPAPVMRQVLAEPGMALFDIELKRELNATLHALLMGMECERAGQIPPK